MCDLSEFTFDHWDPDGLIDSLNKKGKLEPADNIQSFRVTSDMRATTLKHRVNTCHQRERHDFSKGRNKKNILTEITSKGLSLNRPLLMHPNTSSTSV